MKEEINHVGVSSDNERSVCRRVVFYSSSDLLFCFIVVNESLDFFSVSWVCVSFLCGFLAHSLDFYTTDFGFKTLDYVLTPSL